MSILRRSPTRGYLATALIGWCMAVVPMVRSTYALQSSSDRSIQMIAVIMVGVVAVPFSLAIAAGLSLAHAVLRRKGARAPWWYVACGVLLAAAALAFVAAANPSALADVRDTAMVAALAAGVGALLGLVYWLFAVLLP